MSIWLTLFQHLLRLASRWLIWIISNFGKWQSILLLQAICFFVLVLVALLVIFLYIEYGGDRHGIDTDGCS